MTRALFASADWTALATHNPREHSRCPYCPGRFDVHWTKSGFYHRWGQGRKERIRVQCYHCPFVDRWFSLLPDGLLPYRFRTAAWTLKTLEAIIVQEIPVSRWARLKAIARTTVRRVKADFERMVLLLRLPGQEGRLSPVDFLQALARQSVHAVQEIFVGWNELEPKQSILGIYAR
jgi:hypothetical protein